MKFYDSIDSASPFEIKDPISGQVGVNCYGTWYQYWTMGADPNTWHPMYEWDLASVGISEGWTEEQDLGDSKNYLLFREGYFYLTQNWNNAQWEGFRWQPRTMAEFKRMYHLLFKKHFVPEGPIRWPHLEDIENGTDTNEW